MDRQQFTTMANKFQAVLDEQILNERAQALGLVQRLRLVTPFRLGLSVIGSMATQEVQTIADLHRQFNELWDLDTDYNEVGPTTQPSTNRWTNRPHRRSSWIRSQTS